MTRFADNLGHFGATWCTIGECEQGFPGRGHSRPNNENGTDMSKDISIPFMSSLAHHAADPFRLLVESVVDYAIYMVDPGGNIASWNPGAERIYGYRAEEIVGQQFASFFRPDDVTNGKPQQAIERALAAGNFEYEGWRVRRDGSQFWAVITVANLKDYFGNHAGFSVVTRDMTERNRAEEAVRRERDLSAAILSSLPGVYYMYDRQGRFLKWNRRFEVVTEYSADEIAILHPLDLFAGEDKKLVEERIEGVFRTGSGEVEADFVSKSGRRTPYYFNGVRAAIDGQLCLLGMGLDITVRKRAEQALRATDERLRLAARAASVGLWDWDLRSNEVYYSAEWKRQIGYEEHEISTDWDEWQSRVHPDDLDIALQRVRAFLANPALKYEAEFRLRHRDGSYRKILSQAALVFDEHHQPIRMLGSHVDVTDQRRLEKQLQQVQKMEAVGQLAGGVAHDFNNLLTVINGYSDLLLGRLRPDDPMRELLLEINKAGERAGNLTHQLLAFSRQQVLEPKVLDLNAIVRDTEKLLRRLLGEDIILAAHLSPNLGQVKADPGQIEQVLINLAVNARDAMPKGGNLTIETQSVALDEMYCRAFSDVVPGDYVLLAISDTGCGMDEATQARIFEPFFTTKAVGKGTGLGLATVHGIVKQSRGHIAVYSEVGHGTTFKVYLPQVSEPLTFSRSDLSTQAMPKGTETVLLVEDEKAVRALATHILRGCGYRVLEAAHGKDAISIAETHTAPIHLLISDVVMPYLGGRELAERVTKLRPECKVLFLSGYTADAVIRHGVLAADFAFLQKPFTPHSLSQKVRTVLDALS
jgi:two-component system, cell cycle sensor histidine kinase and response regulator CckA